MKGKELFGCFHRQRGDEELESIRALQGHSGNNLDTSTLSHTKILKGDATYLYHLEASADEPLTKSEGLVLVVLATVKGRNSVLFSRLAVGQEPFRSRTRTA